MCVCCSGVLDGQPQSLVRENSQLKDELKTAKQKADECKMMETAVRCRLAQVEGNNFIDEVRVVLMLPWWQ